MTPMPSPIFDRAALNNPDFRRFDGSVTNASSSMPSLTTTLAGPRQWRDVQHALTGGGDGRSCQCCWPIMTSAQWQGSSVGERKRLLHQEIRSGPAPGIVCYANGEAVGWVRVGPRPSQHRLANMRVVKQGSRESADDASVWAITCFSVRREARGMGVTKVLLGAAIDYASTSGARVLEAYPFDNRGTRIPSNELFVGALTTFLHAGFNIVSHPTAKRAVVALKLR